MRLPNDSQRLNIYGQTGSGKTVAGLWHLEKRNFLRLPWMMFDFKRDPTIARIPRLEEIDVNSSPPKQPGVYVVRPLPGVEDDQVTNMLWKIWDRGKTGVFADEAYMFGRLNKAYNSILTQGRAKRIPVIACSQRPSWLSPFQMSEAEFHQVMHIQKPEDVKTLKSWIPGLQPTKRDFHSQYFDVVRGQLDYLLPVPDEEEILDRFGSKMPHRVHHVTGLMRNAKRSQPIRKRA